MAKSNKKGPISEFAPERSLRRDITTAFLVITLISIALVGGVALLTTYFITRDNVHEKQQAITATQTQALSRWRTDLIMAFENPQNLHVARRTLHDFERRPELADLHRTDFRHDILNAGPEGANGDVFLNFYLLNTEGDLMASTQSSELDAIELDPALFEFGSKSTYISPIFYNTDQGEATMLLAQPVGGLTNPDQFAGVLVAAVNLETVRTILQSAGALLGDSAAYLVTRDRTMLDEKLQPIANAALPPTIAQGGTWMVLKSGNEDYRNTDGIAVTSSYRKLDDFDIFLVMEEAQNAAYGDLRILVFVFVGLAILGIVVNSFLGTNLAKRFVGPLEELTARAVEIASGNFEQTINLVRKDEIGSLAKAFNAMTAKLRDSFKYMENRVRERTYALEETSNELSKRSTQLTTTLDIAQAASQILNPQELIDNAVNLIKERFDFYYVGMFLVDDEHEWANLVAGTGEAGQRQLARNHRLKIDDHSMIGWSINTQQARIAADAGEDDVRFVNPDLPETRAEMALPLVSRNEVIGALTVQSTTRGAFSDQDISALQTMADQLATALQNSQFFSQVEETRIRFQDLYDNAPNGYVTLDPNGRIVQINNTLLTMIGYDTEDREKIVADTHLTDLLADGSRSRFFNLLAQLKTAVEPETMMLYFVKRSGETLPANLILAPDRDDAGDLIGIYASAQDISRQEALQRETNTMYQLTQRLLAANTQDEIFEAAINGLTTIYPSRGIAVFLFNSNPDKLEIELRHIWNNPNGDWPPLKPGMTIPGEEIGLGTILKSGRNINSPHAATDEQLSPAMRQFLAQIKIASLTAAPLLRNKQVIGFLLIAHDRPIPFTSDEIRLLEGITRQSSISLNNLNNLQEAVNRQKELRTAAEVAKNVTAETDLDVLLPRVTNLIADAFGYLFVAIFLRDEFERYVVLRAGSGEVGTQLLGEGFKFELNDNSQVGNTFISHADVNTDDVMLSTNYMPHQLLSATRSELTLPLVVRGEVLGVLDLQSDQTYAFDEESVTVLRTLADQIANAIYVANLFDSQRRVSQELQLLNERMVHDQWQSYGDTADPKKMAFATLDTNLEPVMTILDSTEATTEMLTLDEAIDGHSALVTPLKFRDSTIGQLGLLSAEEHQWDSDDLAIIETVTAQAALALENARLIQETQQWAGQLQTSVDIIQSVSAFLEVERLAANSVQSILERFDFFTVKLFLIQNLTPLQGRQYIIGVPTDNTLRTKDFRSLERFPLVAEVVESQKPLVAQENQPQSFSRFNPQVPDVQSTLLLPLMAQGTVLGALQLCSLRPNSFNTDRVTVLEILAAQLATSIKNAQAYQDAQLLNEKLREVDKLKTQFLANMSHELRTPLNSIIGFSRVILKGIDGPLTKLQRDDLTSIHQSGKHLLDLINNILDLAKIEAGKMEVHFDDVELNQMLDSIASTTKGLVKDRPVDIIKAYPDDLPPIEADETRIRQIMLNLVSNAAKFTYEGQITIGADYDDQWVRISVSDSGIGISEIDLADVFEEFTQVDASTTRKAGGTGLGLPITKKFVEMHHGNIRVNSVLEKGTTFTVTLPIRQPAEDEPVEAAQLTVTNGHQSQAAAQVDFVDPQPEDGAKTILVIDSDARVADYYKQYLSDDTFQFEVLTKGESAVETARAVQPYAIFMDILLPDMDGWKLLEDFKHNLYTTRIPVIICSIVDDKHRAQGLGASGYMVKPIIKNDVLETMSHIARLKQHMKHVMVIDDRAEDILLIRRILESDHCQIIEARNGLDGLDMIFSQQTDLVILDLTMPGLDGFGVLEALKKQDETRDLPVIVISARELTNHEQSFIDRYADAMLRKGNYTDTDLLDIAGQYLPQLETA